MKDLARGFTIIELLIATAVFSIVLLFTLTGFFQVGRSFYKGQNIVQTQAAAKQVIDSVTADLKFAPIITGPAASTKGADVFYFCLGNARYTFYKFHQLVLPGDTDSNFGILKDALVGSTACGDPFGVGAPFNTPQELLGNNMRVAKFCVVQAPTTSADRCVSGSGTSSSDLWSIDLIVAYGDNGSLTNSAAENVACDSASAVSRYCAVTELITSATKGFPQ